MEKVYTQPFRMPELVLELRAANLAIDSFSHTIDETGKEKSAILNFAASLESQVDAIMAAHNPTAIDAARTAADTSDSNDNTQVRQAINQLTTYIDGFPTLTATQRADALLLLLRIVRLLLRRFIKRGIF